jgi:hypothetical protein
MGISARHALTEAEFRFVQVYAAFGERDAAEAYRRAFCVKVGECYYEKDGKGEPIEGKLVEPKEASKRAKALLDKPYIADTLAGLKIPAGDQARETLGEQVLFGTDQTRLKAAERILAEEDKLGFRDAADQWAEHMCRIGTEVVVPLPGGAEVVVPLASMFPQFSEALPTPDALAKTMQSLDQYLWVQNGRAKGEAQRDPHDWKFLDGFREYEQLNGVPDDQRLVR